MTLPAAGSENGWFCLATILSRTIEIANGLFNASAEGLGTSLQRSS
jgi:hypothetical protein